MRNIAASLICKKYNIMNVREIYSPTTVLLVNDRIVKYNKAILHDDNDEFNRRMPTLHVYISKSNLDNSGLKHLIGHIFIPETKLLFIHLDRCTIMNTSHEFDYATDVVVDVGDIIEQSDLYVLKFTISHLSIEFFDKKLKQE